MDKESEIINKVSASISPERREEITKLASELSKDKDFRQAAEILGNSQTLDEIRFTGELGWLAALSVAVCTVAVSVAS